MSPGSRALRRPGRQKEPTPPGSCPWCKQPSPPGRSWHPLCVEEWKDEDPGRQRRAVWERDRGRCAACGKEHQRWGEWDADHRVPLEAGGENRVRNLQTLCRRPCHQDKTRREAAERRDRDGT